MARAIAPPPAQIPACRSARAGDAARTLARAASGLVCGAVADIVHEMLMQSMLATDVASMLSGALTSLVARLLKSVRAAVAPARDDAPVAETARPCRNEST